MRSLIDWSYFYHAWKVSRSNVPGELLGDADKMLDVWGDEPVCQALVEQFSAHSDGDNIIIGDTRLPMLRQQSEPYLCLADFIHPERDTVSLFATSVSADLPHLDDDDPYQRMLAQTLADRLAEATAEQMNAHHPGLRPAIGYPCLPDMSLNFIIDKLINLQRIGITLTESGAMRPHASVCGLIIGHPLARYFAIGPIGHDQRADYAQRRGLPANELNRFLPQN